MEAADMNAVAADFVAVDWAVGAVQNWTHITSHNLKPTQLRIKNNAYSNCRKMVIKI